MKASKRIWSMLLAVVMVLTIATPAFANAPDKSTRMGTGAHGLGYSEGKLGLSILGYSDFIVTDINIDKAELTSQKDMATLTVGTSGVTKVIVEVKDAAGTTQYVASETSTDQFEISLYYQSGEDQTVVGLLIEDATTKAYADEATLKNLLANNVVTSKVAAPVVAPKIVSVLKPEKSRLDRNEKLVLQIDVDASDLEDVKELLEVWATVEFKDGGFDKNGDPATHGILPFKYNEDTDKYEFELSYSSTSARLVQTFFAPNTITLEEFLIIVNTPNGVVPLVLYGQNGEAVPQDWKHVIYLTGKDAVTVGPNKPNYGGGNAGTGGGSFNKGTGLADKSPHVAGTTTSKTTTTTVSKSAMGQIENAGSGQVAVRVVNEKTLSANTVAQLQQAAAKQGAQVTLNLDTQVGRVVTSRISISLSALADEIATEISLDSKLALAIERQLKSQYSNELSVMDFAQKTQVGTKARVAVHSPLTNVEDLHFYSVDVENSQFSVMSDVEYTTDANGYIYFTADPSGVIVASEGAFVNK